MVLKRIHTWLLFSKSKACAPSGPRLEVQTFCTNFLSVRSAHSSLAQFLETTTSKYAMSLACRNLASATLTFCQFLTVLKDFSFPVLQDKDLFLFLYHLFGSRFSLSFNNMSPQKLFSYINLISLFLIISFLHLL